MSCMPGQASDPCPAPTLLVPTTPTTTPSHLPDPEGYGWLPKNLNKGRLDLFLLCLGGIMTLNCIIFWRVAVKYEYKTVEHVQRVTVRRFGGEWPGRGALLRADGCLRCGQKDKGWAIIRAVGVAWGDAV